MFSRKKKNKKLDAQAVPVRERVEQLEEKKARNHAAQQKLVEKIELELEKIYDCAESVCAKKKPQK